MLGSAVVRAELRITGVDARTTEALFAFITVDDLSCQSPRWWVNRAFQRMVAEARLALETLGYYRPTFDSSISRDESCWHATLDVVRGEPVRIGSVDLQVSGPLGEETAIRELLDDRPLRKGQRFTHPRYEDAKERLIAVADDLGYFDAQFEQAQALVDVEANRVDVTLKLQGGARYRVGDLEIEQTELRPELFDRLLRVRSGHEFDSRDLVETYRTLLGSQYFDRVLVTPDVEARQAGEVPVRVIAESSSRRSRLLGAGYATDTGPRARAELRYRRLNDRGHRAGISALASAIQGELKADYRVPYGDPSHEWLFAETALTYEDNDTYSSRLWTHAVGRSHLRPGDWLETNYVNYRIDDFDVAGEEGRSVLLLLGSSWSRKTVSEDPRPTRGYALSADVRGGAQALLSDNDVLQTILRGRRIFALSPRVRLLSRATVGWTWQQKFEDLPPSLRFFAGGDNSVRGYDYESLGPEEDGKVVGGTRLLTGTLELDVLLREKWSVALFADAGSAYDDSPDFSRGVGLGLRWYSPLGPLRVDVAHPLDDPNRAVRFHVTLGPDL